MRRPVGCLHLPHIAEQRVAEGKGAQSLRMHWDCPMCTCVYCRDPQLPALTIRYFSCLLTCTVSMA